MNTITIELCEQDRERLDRIADLLDVMLDAHNAEPKEEPEAPEKPATTPEQDIDNAVPFDTKPEPVKQEPKYTLADIRKLVQKLAQPSTGKNAAVKEIVNHFAPNVSGIPEDKYGEVMQLLTALEEA